MRSLKAQAWPLEKENVGSGPEGELLCPVGYWINDDVYSSTGNFHFEHLRSCVVSQMPQRNILFKLQIVLQLSKMKKTVFHFHKEGEKPPSFLPLVLFCCWSEQSLNDPRIFINISINVKPNP